MAKGTQSAQNQPAPFLRKTWDLVTDPETNQIISWGQKGRSFVVWKPAEFARDVLPKYFKHNNFSSFVRQLNTYGFRKVDPDNWEFVNEGFLQGNQDALARIGRRKPSSVPGPARRTIAEPERGLANSPAHLPQGANLPQGGLRVHHASSMPALNGVGSSAFSRSVLQSVSLPLNKQEYKDATSSDGEGPAASDEAWGNSQMALSGLQRFGRLVDDVLRADREGQVGSGNPPESCASSGTDSGDDTSAIGQKRRRLQLAANEPQGSAGVVPAAEPTEPPPQISRPRPASLETMTCALLNDLAGHMTQMRQLTEEVRSLKAQNADLVQQVARGGPRRRGRPPAGDAAGLPPDWQTCLEEQLVQTQHLQEQMEEQAALTEETWQSHSALEARVAKAEDCLCEAGQQLLADKSHVLVSAYLERRLEGQEAAQAQQAKENQGLKARITELEQQLKAEQELSEVRVWNTMLQAVCCASSDASMAEGLHKLLASAHPQAAARLAEPLPGGASGSQPARPPAFLPLQQPRGSAEPSAGAGGGEGSAAAGVLKPVPVQGQPSGQPGSQAVSGEGGLKSKSEPLPGSMAALGFTCKPKNFADGITSRLGRGGASRGGKRQGGSAERSPSADPISNSFRGDGPQAASKQLPALI